MNHPYNIQPLTALCCFFFICPALAAADSTPSLSELSLTLHKLQNEVSALKETVTQQQQEIENLKNENRSLKTTASKPALSSSRTLASANPEIGLVADITGNSTQSKEDDRGNDTVSVREIELVLGHDIDPFSRFDATITLSDIEDVDIEEAYLTHFGLAPIKTRLGRMRQKIGIASASHRDQLDTTDEPLVVSRYLGDEGLFRTGLELSGFIPSFSDNLTHEVVAGVMQGGSVGELLGDTTRIPSFYASLRNFWEISDEDNFTFNGTWLTGSVDSDSAYEVNLFGVQAQYLHYFGSVEKIKFLTEVYLQNRDEPSLKAEGGFDRNPYGFYALLDYRLSYRFGGGFRFDLVQPTNVLISGAGQDIAFSPYVTFFQSEFARWRFQYQHLNAADGLDDNRFWLQGTFAIGVHKHQLQ